MKILVAVDGSEYTQRMLAYLAAHPEWLGGAHQYTLVHTDSAVPPRAAAALDRDIVQDYYQSEHEKVFKPLRAFFDKQGLAVSFVGKVGPAGETIATLATEGGYDLVMLGSHGHGALTSLVMGSVASKVLSHCAVPVLLVR